LSDQNRFAFSFFILFLIFRPILLHLFAFGTSAFLRLSLDAGRAAYVVFQLFPFTWGKKRIITPCFLLKLGAGINRVKDGEQWEVYEDVFLSLGSYHCITLAEYLLQLVSLGTSWVD
jgi:hypothetical protein